MDANAAKYCPPLILRVSDTSMLFNSDWREEMRILRLNNPSYRALFILIDIGKWCLYLAGAALLFAFCWKLISPRNPVLSTIDTRRVLVVGERETGLVTAQPEVTIQSMQTPQETESLIIPLPNQDATTPAIAPEVEPVSKKNTEARVSEDPASSGASTGASSGVRGTRAVGYTIQNKPYQLLPWVMAQNSSRFTIQIGATVNRPFLMRFVDRLPDEHVAALFRHSVNRWNKEVYVLSYGSFTSRAQASAALAKLSPSTRRYGAYIRPFKAIQSEVDASQAQAQQSSSRNGDEVNR